MIARPRLPGVVENKLLTLLGVFQTLFSVGCKHVNFAYVLPIFAWWANRLLFSLLACCYYYLNFGVMLNNQCAMAMLLPAK